MTGTLGRLYQFLELQPARFQSEYKVSYYGNNLSRLDLSGLQDSLNRRGLQAQILYSSNRDLDVLPASVNKGSAARFVAGHLGIADDRLLASGDSGNDLALFLPHVRGIVVGNAHPELKALEGRNIYHSAHDHAAGVLDGIQYWMSCSFSWKTVT